ncbi:hypothetical protein FRC06_005673 [Ceratobasidium sp. 370]|nr:hypothetical protein FRC06_005673 [Ceratobasidium sp. 370]
MLLSYSFAALSVAASFVSARPLPYYRRQTVISDFGTCNATPDIIFALGLDGRKDPAFQAKNNDVYNHGSALGIGVITSFICQQLNDKCKAPAATLDACAAGQAAAAKVTGGAAADAFNGAFGIETTFATSGPIGGTGAALTTAAGTSSAVETSTTSETATAAATSPAVTDTATCPASTTVTVTVDAAATATTPCPTDPVTVTVTGAAPTATEIAAVVTETSPTATATETSAAATSVAAETSSSEAAPPASTGAVSSLDFGSCTNPTIEFGPAFEGRKAAEFSNKPVDKTEFPQASALNINIVTRAICNILANKCKAPQATLDACTKAQAAAAAAPAGTGAGADAFNDALGIQTDFTNVPAAPGGGPGSVALATTPNFGTCSNPTIEFGVGFDGRTEASFQPVNKASFNHSSALNPTIITTFVCDQLVGPCNANKPAIDNCNAAKAAITGLTGQAVVDAFNAAVTKGAA